MIVLSFEKMFTIIDVVRYNTSQRCFQYEGSSSFKICRNNLQLGFWLQDRPLLIFNV